MERRLYTIAYDPRTVALTNGATPGKTIPKVTLYKIGDEMTDDNLKHMDMFDKDDYERMIELHTEHLERYDTHINYYQRSLAQDASAMKEYMDKRDHSNHVLAVAKSRLQHLSA